MKPDPRLDDLLLGWEEVRQQGQTISAEELCRDCPDLLPALRRRIQALQAVDALLDPETGATPSFAPGAVASCAVGTILSTRSQYRVLRLHARGGLGEVLVAHDEELRRDVALKRIQRSSNRDTERRARFLREAALTSRLEHPGIVPVYGLGRDEDGQPCYAMRFIQGETLHEALRDFHAADQAGRDPGERSLALRQLLTRFVGVCNAVAYAHSRGIIHRDLKPANIMLGEYGETLVVDWGLAKQTADRSEKTADRGPQTEAEAGGIDGPAFAAGSGLLTSDFGLLPADPADPATRTGAALGTPAFMSPEQAAGRWDAVGPASDVYSLGATLYTLLTNQTPCTGGSAAEVLEQVRQGRVLPIRHWKRDVSPALEAICRKAMALRPEGRYTSALALAADVEHWLADEPVSVFRDPLSVRTLRLLKRHKAKATAALVLLLSAVVALSISTVLIDRQRQAKDHALVEKEAALDEARANFRMAREAIDSFSSRVGRERLLNEPGLEKLRRELLEDARKFYQRLVEQQSADAATRAEGAIGSYRLAALVTQLDSPAQALPLFQEAVERLEKLCADEPATAAHRYQLGLACVSLSACQAQCLRVQPAAQAAERAVAIQEGLLSDHADVPLYKYALAHALSNRATIGQVAALQARVFGKFFQGRAAIDADHARAVTLLKELTAAWPNVDEYSSMLLTAYNGQALWLQSCGAQETADSAVGEAFLLAERLQRERPHAVTCREDLATACFNVAAVRQRRRQPEEAEKLYQRAAQLLRGLAADFPNVVQHHTRSAEILREVGTLQLARGARREARASWEQAVAVLEPLATRFPDRLDLVTEQATLYRLLGDECARDGASAAALEWYDRLLRVATTPAYEAFLKELQEAAQEGRGLMLGRLGRHQEAAEAWTKAAALTTRPAARRQYRAQRARSQVQLGHYRQAVTDTEQQLSSAAADPRLLYLSACVHAAAAAAVRAEAPLSAAARRQDAQHWADRAVELLQQAQAHDAFQGPMEQKELAEEKDLDPLRSRLDFQQLLEETGIKGGKERDKEG